MLDIVVSIVAVMLIAFLMTVTLSVLAFIKRINCALSAITEALARIERIIDGEDISGVIGIRDHSAVSDMPEVVAPHSELVLHDAAII